jgi:hypothetical protein
VKYFTPDLLAECRSSDPEVAETAAAKWQQRAEAYRRRLQAIQRRLPFGVRRLMRSVTLHDAGLMTTNVADIRGRKQFFLSFRLPSRGGTAGVQLRYDGVKRVAVVLHAPHASGDAELFALYDEFDVLAHGTLTHSLLMTGGVEIRVRFANLAMTPFTRVVAPGRGRLDIKELAEAVAS